MTDHVRTRHDQRHSYQLRLGRDISIEMTPHADASVSAPLGSDYNPANTGISAFIGARLRLDLGNGSPLSFFTDGTVGATGRFGGGFEGGSVRGRAGFALTADSGTSIAAYGVGDINNRLGSQGGVGLCLTLPALAPTLCAETLFSLGSPPEAYALISFPLIDR